jgi:hypothetical protein
MMMVILRLPLKIIGLIWRNIELISNTLLNRCRNKVFNKYRKIKTSGIVISRKV